MPALHILPDTLNNTATLPAIRALLEEHLADMRAWSPPESVHALDLDKLRQSAISFWAVWGEAAPETPGATPAATLLGCGALRQLSATHGEVKSMRTPKALRGRGAARAVLQHIMATARARGYTRLSLETGSQAPFEAARNLYRQHGFSECGPFGDYAPDPNSCFMTREL